jgi:hypothetical protein
MRSSIDGLLSLLSKPARKRFSSGVPSTNDAVAVHVDHAHPLAVDFDPTPRTARIGLRKSAPHAAAGADAGGSRARGELQERAAR